jgi:hypothetical protein
MRHSARPQLQDFTVTLRLTVTVIKPIFAGRLHAGLLWPARRRGTAAAWSEAHLVPKQSA